MPCMCAQSHGRHIVSSNYLVCRSISSTLRGLVMLFMKRQYIVHVKLATLTLVPWQCHTTRAASLAAK